MGKPDADAVRAFVAAQRRAVLATTDEAGRARLVPIAFVVAPGSPGDELTLYTVIDEKPKRSADPFALARVRDLRARPDAIVLVDRWSEEWSELGWVRLVCRGSLVEAGGRLGERATAIAALRAKYPQYETQALEARPLIRLDCRVANAWGAVEEEA